MVGNKKQKTKTAWVRQNPRENNIVFYTTPDLTTLISITGDGYIDLVNHISICSNA